MNQPLSSKIFAPLLFLILINQLAQSGAWTRRKGFAFLAPYYYYYQAMEYFDNSGKKFPMSNNGFFNSNGVGVYFEYGITDNFNITGNIIASHNRWSDNSSYKTNAGFGDFELGLKYKFFERKLVFASQVSAVLPFLYSVEREPLLGYRKYGAEIRVFLSGGFNIFDIGSYYNFELGVRKYFQNFATQFRYQILYGLKLSGRVQVIVQLDGVNSIGSGEFSTPFNPSIRADYVEGKLSISLAYRFTYKAWIQAGFFTDVFGKKIGVGKGFFTTGWIEI